METPEEKTMWEGIVDEPQPNDKELRAAAVAYVNSEDDCSDTQEAQYLMGSPANARRLNQSIEQLKVTVKYSADSETIKAIDELRRNFSGKAARMIKLSSGWDL